MSHISNLHLESPFHHLQAKATLVPNLLLH
jgi:hypothetical protein